MNTNNNCVEHASGATEADISTFGQGTSSNISSPLPPPSRTLLVTLSPAPVGMIRLKIMEKVVQRSYPAI